MLKERGDIFDELDGISGMNEWLAKCEVIAQRLSDESQYFLERLLLNSQEQTVMDARIRVVTKRALFLKREMAIGSASKLLQSHSNFGRF